MGTPTSGPIGQPGQTEPPESSAATGVSTSFSERTRSRCPLLDESHAPVKSRYRKSHEVAAAPFTLFRLTANSLAWKLPSSAGRDDGSRLEGLGFVEELDYGGEGEAHYVEEVAFDAGDPAGGVTLDAVGAGFVEGVAGGEVVGEVGVGDGGEEDAGGFYVGALGGGSDDGDAGVDLVGAVGELAKHSFGVGEVCGFVEDLLFGDNCCVGTEDGGFWVESVDGLRFFEGEALHVGGRCLVGVKRFVDVGGEDVETQAGLGEEVAAAGGG